MRRSRGNELQVALHDSRGLAPPAPQMIERRIRRDAVEPGPRVRVGTKPPERTPGARERLLADILRLAGPEQSNQVGQELWAMALGHLGEGFGQGRHLHPLETPARRGRETLSLLIADSPFG